MTNAEWPMLIGERASFLRNEQNAQQTENREEAASGNENPDKIPNFGIGQNAIFVGVIDWLAFDEVHESEKGDKA